MSVKLNSEANKKKVENNQRRKKVPIEAKEKERREKTFQPRKESSKRAEKSNK